MATDRITLSIKGLKEVERKFQLLEKNAPDLARKVINGAAGKMRDALIGSAFVFKPMPTPFVLKSFAVSLATPGNLQAQVGMKEYTTKTGGVRPHYLLPQVFGGARPQKISEERLGGYYVPGAAAKLNKYGNLMELQQILSAVGARIDAAQRTDLVKTERTRRGSRPGQRKRRLYWFGRLGKKQTLGIWAVGEGRGNERIRPVLIFPDQGRKAPRYSKRWPFFDIARREYRRAVPEMADKYFRQWLAR